MPTTLTREVTDNDVAPVEGTFAETTYSPRSLPLTAFEEYMLCDDRPAYPKTGFFRFRFSGRLNGPAFEAALNTAVQRHPLMRATVRRRPGRRPRWIDNPDWRPVVQQQTPLNAYGYPPAKYMDLTKEPGTRIWVVRRKSATDVVAQIHHSCTDALGMCQVIEDLLVGYASNMGGGPARASIAGTRCNQTETTRRAHPQSVETSVHGPQTGYAAASARGSS